MYIIRTPDLLARLLLITITPISESNVIWQSPSKFCLLVPDLVHQGKSNKSIFGATVSPSFTEYVRSTPYLYQGPHRIMCETVRAARMHGRSCGAASGRSQATGLSRRYKKQRCCSNPAFRRLRHSGTPVERASSRPQLTCCDDPPPCQVLTTNSSISGNSPSSPSPLVLQTARRRLPPLMLA